MTSDSEPCVQRYVNFVMSVWIVDQLQAANK